MACKTAYNLVPGDTLYYQFKAKSGSLSDKIENKAIIQTQQMGSSSSVSLSAETTNSEFNFSTQK
jgi:hypothetical protein